VVPLGLRLHVEADAVPWKPTRHRGVYWHPLLPGAQAARAHDEPSDAVVLIRMDPGCGYPAHRHRGVEDVLVLQGGYTDDLGDHGAGSYLRYPAGSSHSPVASGDPRAPIGPRNPACILFAVARDGVENLP